MTTEATAPEELWRNPHAPVADRVNDLVARMTPQEKIAQLQGIWAGIDAAGEMAPHQHEFAVAPQDFDALTSHGIGQLTRVFGTRPIAPEVGARTLARTQRQIIESSRFGIPAVVHEECLTGLAAWQATVYPSPLCWGASFDPDLVRRMAAKIGESMRRLGVHQGLAPVLDVTRDLRWGRVEETIGEDPHLVGTIGSAYVAGLESAGVVSTLKHFAGYSASRAGRNHAPVSMGPRELADVILPPFEMALRAGTRSVMNSYADNDGVPAAADPTLLTDRLRDQYGFTGTVVADYFSVAFLHKLHGVAADREDAAAQALTAGIDVELPTVDCFGEPLLEGIQAERVDMALIDRALTRVLTQKFELGLLDPGYSPAAETNVDLDDDESRALAREVAERSIVLLQNDGVLPLAGKRLAVIGPRADEAGAMMGCYSFPLHVGVHHPDVEMGIDVPTVLDALREDHDVVFARGCPVLGGTDDEIAEAVEAARQADVCVVVLGDHAGLFGKGTSGEGCDASDLNLPGRQEELLEAVLGTGMPVVLVLLSGRPYDLSRQADRLAAVVAGFYPGQEGAAALAGVLGGRVNPSGRLPVSFPGSGSTQPSTYLSAKLGTRSEVSNVDPTPLYPFGHGLSYAPATWVTVGSEEREWPSDGVCRVHVVLRNELEVATTEVVQIYLHDPVAEVARPVRLLVGAAKVDLEPGQTRTVTAELHADLTSYTGRAGRRLVDTGDVELHVGTSSANIHTALRLTLTGERREVGFDRVMSAVFDAR
ncbi:glycoside hydrolase family 3 N-terminal domain-containing protein [Lentzea sp.]|uniref:beta-xylosidase/alpha-l-arabinosidase n=1 Tax=Lentzea sp. TaxID=56099 RepID=UPI002CEE7F6F|nr:glycoside hydrolase family 3 N-terminal domain-containing protein [Lentzea sp.]HUQ59908.1 glycoside hydrolase family 3 N-terminal domain-containing protein [Lentzea sp.]